MRLFKQIKNRLSQEPLTYLGLTLGSVLITITVACGSGLPEMRPGYFEKPTSTVTHGRIVEKRYKFYNGPRTINYGILEVDGNPVRIKGGAVEFTSYCEVKGIDAVGFTVRGKPKEAGIYILQLVGDEILLERLCDYKSSNGLWKGKIFQPACEPGWDATAKKRIPWEPR